MKAWQRWRISLRAESVRLGGARGPLVRVAVPLGFALPLAVTFGVAAVAEHVQSAGGILQAQSVDTTNAAYWPIYLGSIVFAALGAWAQATAGSRALRAAAPWSGLDQLARWCFLGAIAAAATLLSVSLCLLLLPSFFPVLYGQVNFFAGLRMVALGPVYAWLAVGYGVALGRLLRSPALSIAALTVWALLVENALWLIPGGARLTGWLPFLNGVFATGQDVALFPPWGRDGALVYFAAVGVALWLASLRRRLD